MAVKLLRCSGQWVKIKAHPCWKVEKALQDMGIEYERVNLPSGRGKRDEIQSLSGQKKYPAIQFEDGSVYREESKDMERTIRAGTLMEKAGGGATAPVSG
ncbi:MAG TPA: glutathione S-transferase N-terminal domain-containing protein [Gaiellaceae bacterium]|jgi:glutaredoxin|nr:glutathione S-transferase N-terminal domain-containing protein [Gaiellaceae bacterium]